MTEKEIIVELIKNKYARLSCKLLGWQLTENIPYQKGYDPVSISDNVISKLKKDGLINVIEGVWSVRAEPTEKAKRMLDQDTFQKKMKNSGSYK